MNFSRKHHLTIFARYSFQCSGLKWHAPHDVQVISQFLFNTQRFTIQEKFYLISIIVVCPDVNYFAWLPIPMREDVQYVLVGPFALVHVENVLRETRQINYPEIRAA